MGTVLEAGGVAVWRRASKPGFVFPKSLQASLVSSGKPRGPGSAVTGSLEHPTPPFLVY